MITRAPMITLGGSTRRGSALLTAVLAALLTAPGPRARAQEPKPAEKAMKAAAALEELSALASYEGGVWAVKLDQVKDKDLDAAARLIPDLGRVGQLRLGKDATDAHLAALLPKLRGLRTLELGFNDSVTDAGLAHVKGLAELRKLELMGNKKLTKDGVANLGGLAALETLDLSFTRLTNAAKPLAGLTKLKDLDLSGCGLTDADAAHLAGLAALKKLDLSFNDELTDAGTPPLAKLARLEELELGRTAIGDAGLKPVAQLKELFRLDVSHTKVSDDGLEHLGGLRRLKYLSLSGTKFKGPGLKHLAGAKELEVIDFYDLPEFTGEGLGHLAGCPKFQDVNLSWTGLSDVGLADVKKLRQLKSLDLPPYGWPTALGGEFWRDPHPERFSDKGLKHIGEMANLEWLWLSGSGPTDEGVAHLAGCKSLQTLTLFVTPNVKGPGLAALKALPKLKSLSLRHSGVTDDGLKHLKELKHLELISLPKGAGAKAVEHLKGMKQLKAIAYQKGFDPKALAELKAAFPEADIYVSD